MEIGLRLQFHTCFCARYEIGMASPGVVLLRLQEPAHNVATTGSACACSVYHCCKICFFPLDVTAVARYVQLQILPSVFSAVTA
jgi:hypothetical protein